jgi:hypothetical protein
VVWGGGGYYAPMIIKKKESVLPLRGQCLT